MQVAYAMNQVLDIVHTLFLFTKSDIKCVVVPVTLFALAAAPELNLHHIPEAIAWIWFHLLQCDVSNQALNPEEDRLNKAYRPLPSNRISLRSTLLLRWALIPLCWVFSQLYSAEASKTSLALSAFTLIYNELSGHSYGWLSKNLLNGIGLALFEMGATLIANQDRRCLDQVAYTSIFLSCLIYTTTIHAQDFKDIDGDRIVGRHTMPISLPRIARPSVLFGLLLWSLVLMVIWKLNIWASILLFALAGLTGVRFLFMTSVKDDQVSFYWYNVWISVVHLLAGYYRLVSMEQD